MGAWTIGIWVTAGEKIVWNSEIISQSRAATKRSGSGEPTQV
jgi:hypothetical protein